VKLIFLSTPGIIVSLFPFLFTEFYCSNVIIFRSETGTLHMAPELCGIYAVAFLHSQSKIK
jgi:hypothetical protein